jgi:hypothetical protein
VKAQIHEKTCFFNWHQRVKLAGELLGDDIKWNFVSPQLLAALGTAATARLC